MEAGMDIKCILQKAVMSQNLTEDEAYDAALEIMNGTVTSAQIAGLLIALRMKGETIDEITGFARAMRAKAHRIDCPDDYLVDTCGTGGDQKGTFNISTVSALVAAGAGCRVAKHGNRSVSSRCGSADLLACLGVNIECSVEHVEDCLRGIGIGFLFAPLFHVSMAHVLGPRREMSVRTIFNILGPLSNPAGARRQLIGVYDPSLLVPLASVLLRLGAEHAMIVHGEDGLDEISLSGPTSVSELKSGDIASYTIVPEDLGFQRADLTAISGDNPRHNAETATAILEKERGPRRDITLLNAGAAIYISGRAGSIQHGIQLAARSIDSGSAMAKLEALRHMTAGGSNERA
jgi:anthranilate phosphoribosyltransferase